jgi:hypothetical protein
MSKLNLKNHISDGTKKLIFFIGILSLTSLNLNSQNNFLVFEHNGYFFKAEIEQLIDFSHIDIDSLEQYENTIQRICQKGSYSSNDSIQIGQYSIVFNDVVTLMSYKKSKVEIFNTINSKPIRIKTKTITKYHTAPGLGKSSVTELIIIDRKKRKEITREVIKRVLAC